MNLSRGNANSNINGDLKNREDNATLPLPQDIESGLSQLNDEKRRVDPHSSRSHRAAIDDDVGGNDKTNSLQRVVHSSFHSRASLDEENRGPGLLQGRINSISSSLCLLEKELNASRHSYLSLLGNGDEERVGSSCSSDSSDYSARSVASSLVSSLSGKCSLRSHLSSESFRPAPIIIHKPPPRSQNIVGTSSSVDEFEDKKARMTANLMNNHAEAVTISLVERSSLVQSIIRLSRHVPSCVISTLLDDLYRDRRRQQEKRANRRRRKGGGRNKSSYWRSRRRSSLSSIETCEEEKVYDNYGDRLSSTDRIMNPSQQQPSSIAQSLAGKNTNKPLLPLSQKRQGALLFVDISGFTNLSTMLDVDSFSNCINTYFQQVIHQVESHGGDILKFAGDAIFCEWRVSSSSENDEHESLETLEQCVLHAASCAADIVASCSDFNLVGNSGISNLRSSYLSSSSRRSSYLSSSSRRSSIQSLGESFQSFATHNTHSSTEACSNDAAAAATEQARRPTITRDNRRATFKRRVSVEAPFNRRPSVEKTLNVRCGVGAGHMTGVHVGDSMSRREFLILGDPIDQVATAEAAAGHGEVFASPEATTFLAKMGTIEGDWESNVNHRRPTLLAVRGQRFFATREEFDPSCCDVGLPCGGESLLRHIDSLDSSELHWLKRMILLYVHPVVVNEENECSPHVTLETADSAAELRNVFTCFISPKIDPSLTGDEVKDQKLLHRLNAIMAITTKHLDSAQGHLRQFIVDDKGIVLIFTFGLRGSTFPNMIAQRALPLTFAICHSLEEELGINVAAGATFGRAYCGVVGGFNRHEFAVLGPAVNLAARLMSPKHNSGVILVDNNVRLLTSQIFFRPLPDVKAKGYADPVPIFEPAKISTDKQVNKWARTKKKFVGRANEIKQIMQVAKAVMLTKLSKFLFMSAASGSGKSTLMMRATESIRAMVKKMKKSVVITRYISNEGDSRIPFSLFRSIFKDLLLQLKDDDVSMSSSRRGSWSSSRSRQAHSGNGPVDFEIDKEWDSLSIHSYSTYSTKGNIVTTIPRFQLLCEELNAPYEFIEWVGKRLLGLKSTAEPSHGSKPPDLDKIVSFMADAYLYCTKHADLVLLALDDVHWMDEMSWKVVQLIFERSENVLIFCGSRLPSTNPLAVDEKFWSELRAYKEEGCYMDIILGPFLETDVREMIAYHLDIGVDEIDSSFWRNVLTTSGGMPHYLNYVLDTIKRNNLTAKLDNGLIGLKNSESDESKLGFKSVNDLLLYRLDALDASLRTTFQLAAVMGTEFNLLDAALSYEEMFDIDDSNRFHSAMELCAHFDVAEREGILEKVLASAQRKDEFGDQVNEEDVGLEASAGRKSHPLFSDKRRYRFTHDSWKTSILSVMLDGRKEEMHENIAIVFEREIDKETESEDDLEMQIRVFKHWNLSGNFSKAADLALKIGGQLMTLGLNSQADLLFSDVILGLKYDQGGIFYGGICSSVLDAVEPPELELLLKLYITKGKALCNLAKGKSGANAYQSALDILHYTPCAFAQEFDRSVSFPIFSGLFLVLKMGVIKQDEGNGYEIGLCKQFVEQARLNNDPVHYGRALAMQGETLSRLGKFEEALDNLETIKSIYDIETQHAAICKAYGSDRVGQAFSHSVNWNHALGRTNAALATCKYIVEELVPKSDPKNAHNTFCLLYSVIVTMKENGMALEARELFIATIVAPFEENFGSGGSTFTKPMWQPILMVLDMQGNRDKDVTDIGKYLDWALDASSYALKPVIEGAMGNFSATPLAIFAEVPYYLAMRTEIDLEKKKSLVRTACSIMEKSLENAQKCIPYAKTYAQEKLVAIRVLTKELDIDSATIRQV